MSRYRIVRIAHPDHGGFRYDVERHWGFFSWEWFAGFETFSEAEAYLERLRAVRVVVKRVF